MFSCSKIEQKQLNTWVSFQSAEQPLLGQFSVSGNSLYAYTAINAPRGLKERIFHEWTHNGQRVDRIALEISGGR